MHKDRALRKMSIRVNKNRSGSNPQQVDISLTPEARTRNGAAVGPFRGRAASPTRSSVLDQRPFLIFQYDPLLQLG